MTRPLALATFDKICHSDKLRSMATMNISLPEALREFVDARLREGGYGTASEYVRELIRNDQKRHAGERLEALLLDGLDSGEPIEITDEFWRKKRKELTATAGKNAGK